MTASESRRFIKVTLGGSEGVNKDTDTYEGHVTAYRLGDEIVIPDQNERGTIAIMRDNYVVIETGGGRQIPYPVHGWTWYGPRPNPSYLSRKQ